jgi:hypothetical protein
MKSKEVKPESYLAERLWLKKRCFSNDDDDDDDE